MQRSENFKDYVSDKVKLLSVRLSGRGFFFFSFFFGRAAWFSIRSAGESYFILLSFISVYCGCDLPISRNVPALVVGCSRAGKEFCVYEMMYVLCWNILFMSAL